VLTVGASAFARPLLYLTGDPSGLILDMSGTQTSEFSKSNHLLGLIPAPNIRRFAGMRRRRRLP
jgi:hypothetical protein